MSNKVIAIQNYGSSGTLFLQSLFDGHPDILSLPALYLREIFRFWEECAPFQSIEELVVKFVTSPFHAYWFDPNPDKYRVLQDNGLLTLGNEGNENIAIDRNKFIIELCLQLGTRNELSLKNLFLSVYYAYARVKNKEIKENMWMLFPIHANPKVYAEQLIELSDEVRFIHMIRDPADCVFSLVKHLLQTNCTRDNIFGSAIKHIILDIPHHGGGRAYGLEPYVENNAKVQSVGIRLEDLHVHAEAVLHSLCEWLMISWDGCLLKSTFDGKAWHNRQGSMQSSGFNKSFVEQKYQTYSNNFDYLRIKHLALSHRQAFRYETKNTAWQKILLFIMPILLILPFKADLSIAKIQKKMSLKDYIQARIILFKAYLNNFKCTFNFVKLLKIE